MGGGSSLNDHGIKRGRVRIGPVLGKRLIGLDGVWDRSVTRSFSGGGQRFGNDQRKISVLSRWEIYGGGAWSLPLPPNYAISLGYVD